MIWMCVCNLRYPVCNVVAPYCRLWLPGPAIFLHFTLQTAQSPKESYWTQNVSIFSTTFVWNISHSRKTSTSYDQKCILIFMYSTRYSYHILMKRIISTWFWINTQISNFMEILQWEPSSSMRTDRRTEVQTDTTKIIVVFRNFS